MNLLLSVLLAGLCAQVPAPARTSSKSASLPPLAIGDPIPTWRLPVENPARWGSASIDLRDWQRGGPRSKGRLIVTFAASWCRPCKRELEALRREAPALEARSAQVVVVVADQEAAGRAQMVRWLIDVLDAPYAVVADELGLLSRRYRADQLPAAFVADGSGRLIWARTGYEPGSIAELLELLRTAP